MGWISALINAGSKERQMKESRKQTTYQRDWDKMLSDTAYQRSMTDMRAAGLNPMLAYMQGGASTPNSGRAESLDTGKSAVDAFNATSLMKAQTEKLNKESDILSPKATAMREANELLKKGVSAVKNPKGIINTISDFFKSSTAKHPDAGMEVKPGYGLNLAPKNFGPRGKGRERKNYQRP